MSKQVERLGVAVQGAGNVSTEHLRAYVRNPHCELVAVASRTLEGAERKAREVGLDLGRVKLYDYAALLDDPRVDALSICTPPERHAREVVLGARAGKHLLIEKPVATEPDGLAEMAAAVRAAGVRTVVNFVLRRNPLMLPDSGAVSHHPFPQEIDHFVDCILSGRESHVSLRDAVNTHEACFAADRSAACGGAPVALNRAGDPQT